MACDLTQANLIPCRDSRGGVDETYIAEIGNKGVITTTSGVITGFTMGSGKKFWTYKMERDNASFTDVTTVNTQAGTKFNQQDCSFTVKQLNSSNRNELDLLAKNRCMVIHKDGNGKYWLLGELNGMDVVTIAAQSGKAYGDLNGSIITMTGQEREPAKEVTASLMATLTVAA